MWPRDRINRIEAKASGNKAGELLLYGDIGPSDWGMIDEVAVADALKKLGPVDLINLRINSSGGGAFSGIAIYNQLMRHPARIEVDVDGLAASIASVIAMAGDEIRMGEGSQMMIHDASSPAWGNAGELRRTADLLDSISGDIAAIYARRSRRKLDEFRDLMRDETWFTAEAAVEAKLATAIVADNKAEAHLDPEIAMRFKHPPKALLAPRQIVDLGRARNQIASVAQRIGQRAKSGA